MKYDAITRQLASELAGAAADAYPEITLPELEVTIPTQRDKADFVNSTPFRLAKELKMPPLQISQAIVEKLTEQQEDEPWYMAEAVAPGFINFRLSDKALLSCVRTIQSERQQYGRGDSLEGQCWVIEHTSPNPNKAMHVGHLRNNLIGMAVASIAEFSGATVIRDCVDNDRGIAIARAMWGYLKYKQRAGVEVAEHPVTVADWLADPNAWVTPGEVGAKPDHFVGDCYAIGAKAAKEDENADREIRQIALDWENNNEAVWALWKLIIDYAHEGINQTLERIGNRWDVVWHEHEHYKDGKDMVLAGLEKGIFKQLDDGAILTDLEAYNIPNTIVLKSDGTSLYITQDIALTRMKKERFNADRLLWVIGPEQSVAMKQVFAISEQLGVGDYNSFIHLPYGLVNIADETGAKKKMSSRDGNTLYIDQLIDEVKALLLGAERGYEDTDAELIAINAIKYAMLRPSRVSDTLINIDEAVSLKGDSGVYILYTGARMRSLLDKHTGHDFNSNGTTLSEGERRLAVDMLYFPQKVRDALESYAPNVIVEYILELSQAFNSLYAKEQFISDDQEATANKIAITAALNQVLTNALSLLGMEPVKKI